MLSYKTELYHHGIKGQRWGVRRFQNDDGSLTAAGQKRYNKITKKYDRMSERHRNLLNYNKKLSSDLKRDIDALKRDKFDSKQFKESYDDWYGPDAVKKASKKYLQIHYDWLLDSNMEGYELAVEDAKRAQAEINRLENLKVQQLQKYGLAGKKALGHG